jgi:hypothetical protein
MYILIIVVKDELPTHSASLALHSGSFTDLDLPTPSLRLRGGSRDEEEAVQPSSQIEEDLLFAVDEGAAQSEDELITTAMLAEETKAETASDRVHAKHLSTLVCKTYVEERQKCDCKETGELGSIEWACRKGGCLLKLAG